MSRSGFYEDGDDDDQWAYIRWQGALLASIKGKRGQQLLRELRDALDAMPEKKLIAEELEVSGSFCALGVVGAARGINLDQIDTWDWSALSAKFDISETLARQIMYINDEAVDDYEWVGNERKPILDQEERRWKYVRDWVESHIVKEAVPA